MSRTTWTGSDIAKDVLKTSIPANEDELYAIKTEVENARDGEATLKDQIDDIQANVATVTSEVTTARNGEASLDAKIDDMDANILALANSNGSMISSDDTNPDYLGEKLVDGDDTETEISNGGADETIQVNFTGNKSVYNLIKNSRFTVNSQCSLGAGFSVFSATVTDITSGVCTLGDATGSVAVGDLVYFTGGGSTNLKYYEVTDTGTGTFTISDTSVTDATMVNVDRKNVTYAGANSYASDGWIKQTTASITMGYDPNSTFYRNHVLCFTPTVAYDFLQYPADSEAKWWLQQVRGRTVTFGAWVNTSVSDSAYLVIRDTAATVTEISSKHSGSGNWEWIEVSATIPVSVESLFVRLSCLETTGVIFFTHPTLIYGSHIGEGNYSPNPHDRTALGASISLPTIVGDNQGDVSATTLNIFVETQGKLAGDIECLSVRTNVKADQEYAGTEYLQIGSDVANGLIDHENRLPNNHNAQAGVMTAPVYTNESGDITYLIETNGTFDVTSCDITAVEVR